MAIVLIILYVVVVLAMHVRPRRSEVSAFELKRRSQQGDEVATEALRRERLLPSVMVVRNFVIVVVGLAFVGCAIGRYGMLMGMLVAGLAVMSLGPARKLRTLTRLMRKQYGRVEEGVLDFVERFGVVFDFFRDISEDLAGNWRVDSREELEHVISTVGDDVISEDEKAIMLATVKFSEKKVSDVMVAKSQVVYLRKDELLTPVVLDKLHKTSFSHFPVVGEDIDHMEGILRARDVLNITEKKSPKVSSVMEKRVYFVRDDHGLDYALNAFVRTGYCFFVVINEHRETVGILTLRDLMESLLGKKVEDEFDEDDSRAAVAGRKPINSPKGGVDV